jgi:hypothetical protein
MKDFTKKVLLISGLLVAMLICGQQVSWADTTNLEELEQQQEQLAALLVNEMEMETNLVISEKTVYKIYNHENKQVYESRNSEDQKLKILLNKSDLLTTIDNISYFKLSR